MAVLRAHILLELALVLGLVNFILINYLRFEFHSKDLLALLRGCQ